MDIGGELTAKLGPLPVYAWAGIGGVGLAVLVFLRKRSSAAPGGPITLQPATGDTGSGGGYGSLPFAGGGGGGGGGVPPSTPPVQVPIATPVPQAPPEMGPIGQPYIGQLAPQFQAADYTAHLPSLASLYSLAVQNPLPSGINPGGVPQVLPFPYVQTSGPTGDNRVVDRTSQLQPVYASDGSGRVLYYSQPTVLNIPSAGNAANFQNTYHSGAPWAVPGQPYDFNGQNYRYTGPLAPGQAPPLPAWLRT